MCERVCVCAFVCVWDREGGGGNGGAGWGGAGRERAVLRTTCITGGLGCGAVTGVALFCGKHCAPFHVDVGETSQWGISEGAAFLEEKRRRAELVNLLLHA